ncbi:MAG: mannose-6-phosphate isomerase [Bacteroides sp. SM23_62]|nr:MAG: mannose-6-phosphate isomerase [Bacteroides sp. SM23_62]
MDKSLYPLRFHPIYKPLIWGGEKLREDYGKTDAPEKTGESWEISQVEDNISLVSNGFLEGKSLEEIIQIYKGELVGHRIFERFGTRFPILTKFIHSNDDLSIQVHPGDQYAALHHGENGKTEMWYILDSEKDAKLIVGFNRDINREILLEKLNNGTLKDILNYEKVSEGDVIFLPEGRIHALGPGIVLAEIQQTSDRTYRIYDWDRVGRDGKPRELHIEHALNVLDFKAHTSYKSGYRKIQNATVNLIECPYFSTQIIHFDRRLEKDYTALDCFVIYMCLSGDLDIRFAGENRTHLSKGDTILIPAVIKDLSLIPLEDSSLLEIYL